MNVEKGRNHIAMGVLGEASHWPHHPPVPVLWVGTLATEDEVPRLALAEATTDESCHMASTKHRSRSKNKKAPLSKLSGLCLVEQLWFGLYPTVIAIEVVVFLIRIGGWSKRNWTVKGGGRKRRTFPKSAARVNVRLAIW